MTALPEIASVHPHTITRHSAGERLLPRPRLRAVTPHDRLTTIRVHPLVWVYALRAADGDALRIEVHGPTNVTVHNTRAWKRVVGNDEAFIRTSPEVTRLRASGEFDPEAVHVLAALR